MLGCGYLPHLHLLSGFPIVPATSYMLLVFSSLGFSKLDRQFLGVLVDELHGCHSTISSSCLDHRHDMSGLEAAIDPNSSVHSPLTVLVMI